MNAYSKVIKTVSLSTLFLASTVGTAFADPVVAITGAIDMGPTFGSGSIDSVTKVSSSNYNSSNLALKATDDFAAGLKGGIWLEAGVSFDSGLGQTTNTSNQTSGASTSSAGLTLNRRSTASLGGNWGEVRIGRDMVPLARVLYDYEPFDGNGTGASQVANSLAVNSSAAIRASNSVSYIYGKAVNASASGYAPRGSSGPGLLIHTMYYTGENTTSSSTPNDGRGYGLRANYSTGNFSISGAYGQTFYLGSDEKRANAGASYNFGWANVMAMYESDRVGDVNASGGLIGATVPYGVGTVRFSYSKYGTDASSNPSTSKFSLGYVYPLSPKASVYMAAAQVSNSGTATSSLNGSTTAAGSSSNGFDVGYSYTF